MYHYALTVSEAQQGMSLLALLRRAYPLAPDWAFRKAMQDRDVKVDGRRVSANLTVRAGQQVEWYTRWLAAEIPVLYEDELLLIVSKPAGLNTDESEGAGMTLISWARARAEDHTPRLVHRLDNQTSGLLMIAKTAEAEQALGQALKAGSIIKTYECLVGGIMSPPQAILTAWLTKDAARARVSIYSKPVADAREIMTEYRVLSQQGAVSRLEVRLHTGRTHQIRAHLAWLGHPLLGDDKYGDRALNRRLKAQRLMLAATALSFDTDGRLEYLKGRSFVQEAPF